MLCPDSCDVGSMQLCLVVLLGVLVSVPLSCCLVSSSACLACTRSVSRSCIVTLCVVLLLVIPVSCHVPSFPLIDLPTSCSLFFTGLGAHVSSMTRPLSPDLYRALLSSSPHTHFFSFSFWLPTTQARPKTFPHPILPLTSSDFNH